MQTATAVPKAVPPFPKNNPPKAGAVPLNAAGTAPGGGSNLRCWTCGVVGHPSTVCPQTYADNNFRSSGVTIGEECRSEHQRTGARCEDPGCGQAGHRHEHHELAITAWGESKAKQGMQTGAKAVVQRVGLQNLSNALAMNAQPKAGAQAAFPTQQAIGSQANGMQAVP